MSTTTAKKTNGSLEESKYKDVAFQRTGMKVVIPEDMSWDEVILWAGRRKNEDERVVAVHHELPYQPLDGAVAFQRALQDIHGWADLVPIPSWWGPQPPHMIGVKVAHDKSVQVPWGRIQVQGIEGHLETGMLPEPVPRFTIRGEVKHKNLAQVQAIVERTERFLKESSIYKAQAVRVSYEWQRVGHRFDASQHCPQFMRLAGVQENDLIFGRDVQTALDIGLFTPIRYAAAMRKFQVPLKRGILLHGQYGCLAADTMISVNRGGKGFEVRIEDLFRRYTGEDKRYAWDKETPTLVQHEAADGTIRLTRMANVWRSGMKQTYRLVTSSGRSIKATDEHPFLTDKGWRKLGEIHVGDVVHVRGTQATGSGNQRDRNERAKYRALAVGRYHPFGKGNQASGWHVAEHRLVVESQENGLSLDDFLRRVKAGETDGLVFLDPEVWVVHHKDENSMNNSIGNLVKMTQAEHAALHGEQCVKNVLFKAAMEDVILIESVGTEMTYDIEVEAEPHNFVANGFVVHNTGKTLTANVTALKAVRAGFTFVYLESVLDLKKGLQFAAQYGPSVLFAEDIDRAITGERTLSMDEILNCLDGVDTKGNECIVVFTTNKLEDINPAMLRMGRLDTLVEIKPPDSEAAQRLVRLYGRGLLAPSTDYDKVGAALAGKIPAYIREVVERAKIAAILRLDGEDIGGKVLEEDLLSASVAMENHAALLTPKKRDNSKNAELLVRIPPNFNGHVEEIMETLGLATAAE